MCESGDKWCGVCVTTCASGTCHVDGVGYCQHVNYCEGSGFNALILSLRIIIIDVNH